MKLHQLYLLQPRFSANGQGPFFCPGCAMLAGMLEFYPELKPHLDVHYVDFPRPRRELAALLGGKNQSCPVLVLAGDVPPIPPPDVHVQLANGHAFIKGPEEIARFLAHHHRTGMPYATAPTMAMA